MFALAKLRNAVIQARMSVCLSEHNGTDELAAPATDQPPRQGMFAGNMLSLDEFSNQSFFNTQGL